MFNREIIHMKSSKITEVQSYIIQRLKSNESGVDLFAQGWRPHFNKRLTACIGRCNYKKKKIEISLHFLHNLTEEEYKDAVNHEIAHALTPWDKHGPKWRLMARMLGANPSPYTKLKEPPKPKYVITFLNKDGQYEYLTERNRRQNLTNSYIPGRKEETHGKMFMVTYEEFEKLREIQ